MSEDTENLVRRFWSALGDQDWEGAAATLAEDYTGEWPQSRERIAGREAFVAINAHYPGTWRITVERLVVDDAQVATRVSLTDHERGRTEVAVSFFAIRDGLIYHQEDWWPEPYDAPAWRAAWVQPME